MCLNVSLLPPSHPCSFFLMTQMRKSARLLLSDSAAAFFLSSNKICNSYANLARADTYKTEFSALNADTKIAIFAYKTEYSLKTVLFFFVMRQRKINNKRNISYIYYIQRVFRIYDSVKKLETKVRLPLVRLLSRVNVRRKKHTENILLCFTVTFIEKYKSDAKTKLLFFFPKHFSINDNNVLE